MRTGDAFLGEPEHLIAGLQGCAGKPGANDGVSAAASANAIRQPRDRLRGQPQERQHSAARRRDAGPTAGRRGVPYDASGMKAPRAETHSAPFTTAQPVGDPHTVED